MDFNSSPGPLLAYRPPDDGGHFITDWKWWLETAGNFALASSVGAFIQRGRLFSTSFKLYPSLPKAAPIFLPFSVFVEKPGLLHLALDVAFYKGTGPAFEWTQEQYEAVKRWLATVDSATLRNTLGPAAFDELTAGGTITQFNAVVEMPPAWLTDP